MGLLDPQSGMDYLTSQGWSPTAAAGILGNAYGESRFNTSAIGDNGSAFGLFQTHPNLHPGFSPGMSGMDQLAFTSNELKTKFPGLASRLNSTSSVADATSLFMHGYERPANYSSLGKRIAGATDILNKGSGLLKDAQGLLNGQMGNLVTEGLNAVIPGAGTVASMFGIGGDGCDWLCQLKQWIRDTGFFQRIALAILAFIILLAAFYLYKPSIVDNAVKAAATA